MKSNPLLLSAQDVIHLLSLDEEARENWFKQHQFIDFDKAEKKIESMKLQQLELKNGEGYMNLIHLQAHLQMWIPLV